MALENSQVVDAVGVDKRTGDVVLTLLDSWDWEDEGPHLLVLQAKLNAYFEFIESGQLEAHTEGAGRKARIDVIGRFPISAAGATLLERARQSSADLGVTIRSEHPKE